MTVKEDSTCRGGTHAEETKGSVGQGDTRLLTSYRQGHAGDTSGQGKGTAHDAVQQVVALPLTVVLIQQAATRPGGSPFKVEDHCHMR